MNKELIYRVIFRFRNKYSVIEMCSLFDVCRSGYYYWIKKQAIADKDDNLANLITECQISTKQTYGYRRVKAWLLRKYDMIVNHKKLLRIMNKYSLLAQIRRRRKYKFCCDELHRYDNILNRKFTATRPNEKWVTDITYIHTAEGTLYLSAIRDLYDSSIISYNTGSEQNVKLVTDTIIKAVKTQKVTNGLVLHSDQGSQYTSNAYNRLTKEYGITPSMSRRGNCYDNACAENFFGILKSECINRFKPQTLCEAKELINEYIQFYNYERIQLKTNLTPHEIRCQVT